MNLGETQPCGREQTVCACVVSVFSSVQFSRSVASNSLWPHESQHARPPCPSPSSGVHSDSLPSSLWYHPAISSSVVPFSSCSQSLPASESFPMSQLFTWGGQKLLYSQVNQPHHYLSQNWGELGDTGTWAKLGQKSPSLFGLRTWGTVRQSFLRNWNYKV